MKTYHRVLLWCVAAWMYCIVVNCHVEFFDADGNALREEDILDNDWLKMKIREDSYRTKPNLILFKDDDETPDENIIKLCEKECGVTTENLKENGVECIPEDTTVKCKCENEEVEKKSFDYFTKQCKDCSCGANAIGCTFNKEGKKTCKCINKFADKNGKCEDCECGDNAIGCTFNKEGEKTCNCINKFGEKNGKCEDCECGDNAIGCTFNTEGEKTCNCINKFGEKNGKCEDCECGDNAIGCTFNTEGEKTCNCINKFGEKNGKCEDCECGDNAIGCTFNTEGEKTCNCINKFGEKNGKCEDCECGDNAIGCTFNTEGEKTCNCINKFGEKNGKCEDCECGDNAIGCTFNTEGEKTCNCINKFAEKNGKCEDCVCGDNAIGCTFNKEGEKTCNCINKFAEKNGKCEDCACGDNAIGCTFNKEGGKACNCINKFAEKNGKCEDCACGDNAIGCTFNKEGEKICNCINKFAEKNGKCEDCVCGDNAIGCTFNKEGEKTCNCINKFAEKNGKCEDCACGGNAISCTFNKEGEKTCKCTDKFAEKNGKCEDCACGDNAVGCTFNKEGEKTCNCINKFAEKNGKCEDCACGGNAIGCTFNKEGEKTCKCTDKFAEKNGKCEDCACGDNAVGCTFNKEGEKTCNCINKFAEKNGKCEACDCGTNATGCSFNKDGTTKCACKEGFAQKGETCEDKACVDKCGVKEDVRCKMEENNKCECTDQNKKFDRNLKECRSPCVDDSNCKYGICENIGESKFCECPKGTSGEKCEVIEDCKTGKYSKCKGARGNCTYDLDKETAVCLCKEGKKLMDQSGYCSTCDCGDHSTDCTFVKDKIECKCESGYSSKNEKCEVCNCGENSDSCSFNQKDGQRECECKKGYGDDHGTCRKCNCGENSDGCLFENGKERCICKSKFALKDGKCEACNCGDHSMDCRYEGENKICDCKKGYKEKNGICEECNCGDNSTSCRFENGNKICRCKAGNAQNGEKCEECKCGDHMKPCKFENGEKKCECVEKFGKNKEGKCTECKCGDKSKGCTFKGDNEKECHCEVGYGSYEGTCTEDQCYKKCRVTPDGHEEVECKGTRYGNGTNIKCSCIDETLKFDSTKWKCRETCDEKKECKNHATCKKIGENDFCDCLNNTEGHFCEILTECGEGKRLGKCTGDRGKCVYDKEKREAKCDCTENKLLDPKEGYCQDKCTKNEECSKSNKICFQNKYCSCEDGKSGDNCEIATGCNEELKKKCEIAGAECAFSRTPPKFAACVCKDENLVYKEDENKCVAKFCIDVGCGKDASCEIDADTKTAYCKCPSGKYYNYNTETCLEPDKCLLRKTPCKENEVCEKGDCKCKGEVKEDKCLVKFCKEGACFEGAECNEDTATCYCPDGKYFTGTSCKDVKCVKNPFDESCDCAPGMEKNTEKKCVPKGGKPTCEKECGLGYCVEGKCSCIDGISKLDKDKCVLDKDKVCASKELKDSSTCKCTGKYKQSAKDGVTCELVTCSDDEAKQKCKNEKATCKMTWKGSNSIKYSCECPAGYTLNTETGICTDSCNVYKIAEACSLRGQVCYNSYSVPNRATTACDCAPPFRTTTKNCDDVADYAYLISGIPVMKKRYQMEYGIDYVRLNSDLMQSLAQMYNKDIFDSGYLHDYVEEGDVLKTSVWVRFNQNISGQLNRFKLQAQSFPNGTCDDCDTDLYVWPPNVVLKGNDFKDVKAESLNVCAAAMKNGLCGEEAECRNNTCFCPRGYRTLEYTIRTISNKARILRCEKSKVVDLDECALGTHECPGNTTCFKVTGTYICKCKPGYWKSTENDQKDCFDLCTPSPCDKGTCSMKKDKFNCNCQAGYSGSYCEETDVNFASAKKSTVVVGAVLGTILIVGVLAALFFYIKKRKNSYSEDFMPAPRQDIASEMRERRPIRGVVNNSYE